MPTVKDNARADAELDENGNVLGDEAHQPEENEIEDDITSHPKFQDLEKKYSAARKKMDATNVELKKIREEYKIPKKKGEDDIQEEDDVDFKIFHSDEIKLVASEWKSYKAKGLTNEDALRLAKLDKGLTDAPVNEQVRQSARSQAPAVVDRSGGDDELSEGQKQAIAIGVKPETVRKYKDLVEG